MNILIIDDHALFRDGLKFLLADLDENLEFHEAGTINDGLLAAPQTGKINIVLLDLNLPDSHGIEGLKSLRSAFEKAMIVVLSSDENAQIIRDAIAAGAAGYIPKSSTQDVLMAALRLVLAGGTYLPPNLLHASPAPLPGPVNDDAHTPLNHLSERQREVLMCAVQGKANKVIARELDISEATVKAHMSASFRALGVKNRTEAVYAVANAGAA